MYVFFLQIDTKHFYLLFYVFIYLYFLGGGGVTALIKNKYDKIKLCFLNFLQRVHLSESEFAVMCSADAVCRRLSAYTFHPNRPPASD